MKNNMKENSRTKNVTINASWGMLTQIVKIILEFIVRTVFIKCLGSEYLGVNGLFTNILTVLSFAELGIGNAIIFSMYKEISNKNEEKIKSLMKLYKQCYITIGFIVFFVGIGLMPFIRYIINGEPNIKENILLIYFLFLLNTSISYFFSYKKAIISAHQKEYIINIYKLITEVIKVSLQIAILIITKNFILYLLIQILCTILDNVLTYIKANKMYDYINDKNIKKLEKEERHNIFVNVKSLVMYKFGSIILNGTDNVIISKMLSLSTVGILSNFNLITNTVTTLVGSVLNGFTASVGNLNTTNDIKKQENVFKQISFVCFWIYGFCAIGILSLSNDFMELWVGKEYQLPLITVFAIVLHLYINGVQFTGYTYRVTMGLFKKGKYCPIIAAIINIILSIALCKLIGLSGIIFATSISRLITTTWYDIFMVYKYKFNSSPLKAYTRYLFFTILVIINGFVTYNVINLITTSGILGFIIKLTLVIIITNTIFLLLFFKTYEFKAIYARFKELLWKKKNAI